MLVGEPLNNFGGHVDCGAAYFYTNTGGCYDFDETIRPDSILAGAWFGHSVDLDGDADFALIGAPRESGAAFATGAAYNFENTEAPAWNQINRFTQSPYVGGIEFGWDVALSDNQQKAIIGAPGIVNVFGGRAYVINTSANEVFDISQVLDDSNNTWAWGISVAIDSAGDQMLVGSPISQEASLYVENTDSMELNAVITGADILPFEDYGADVALSPQGRYALVGAPLHEHEGVESGSAYAQNLLQTCKEKLFLTTGIIPTGTYRANQLIQANIPTGESSDVVFISGNEVILDPTFEVGESAEFEIQMNGCDTGIN